MKQLASLLRLVADRIDPQQHPRLVYHVSDANTTAANWTTRNVSYRPDA